jgi:hypothetical protein
MSKENEDCKTESVSVGSQFSMSVRSYFSLQFITSAALFAREAYRIEQEERDEVSPSQKEQHRTYVLGSIVFSVTFLEALVNEMATDYSEEQYHHFSKMKNRLHEIIGQSWKEGIYPTSILQKYQQTLFLTHKSAFDTGQNPYQNVYFLKGLRNRIIHFEPEHIEQLNTAPDEDIKVHTLEKRLEGKFAENPFYADTGNAFYPEKCLGHGCAEWAVKSSVAFADRFFDKLEVDCSFRARWSKLETK